MPDGNENKVDVNSLVEQTNSSESKVDVSSLIEEPEKKKTEETSGETSVPQSRAEQRRVSNVTSPRPVSTSQPSGTDVVYGQKNGTTYKWDPLSEGVVKVDKLTSQNLPSDTKEVMVAEAQANEKANLQQQKTTYEQKQEQEQFTEQQNLGALYGQPTAITKGPEVSKIPDTYKTLTNEYMDNLKQNYPEKYQEELLKIGTGDKETQYGFVQQSLNWKASQIQNDLAIYNARGYNVEWDKANQINNNLNSLNQKYDIKTYQGYVQQLKNLNDQYVQNKEKLTPEEVGTLKQQAQEIQAKIEANPLWRDQSLASYNAQAQDLQDQYYQLDQDAVNKYNQAQNDLYNVYQAGQQALKDFPEVEKKIQEQKNKNIQSIMFGLPGQEPNQVDKFVGSVWDTTIQAGVDLVKLGADISNIAAAPLQKTQVNIAMDKLQTFTDGYIKMSLSSQPLFNQLTALEKDELNLLAGKTEKTPEEQKRLEELQAKDGTINSEEILPTVGAAVTNMALLLFGANKVTAAVDAIGVGSGLSSEVGLFASSMATTFENYKNQAVKAGWEYSDAIQYALGMSALTSSLELISPNTMIRGGAIEKKVIQQSLTAGPKNFYNTAWKVLKEEVAPENIQEIAQGYADKIGNYLANQTMDKAPTQKMEDSMSAAELKETIIATTAATLLLAGGTVGQQNKAERDSAKYYASQNFEQFQKQVDDAVKVGQITPEYGQQVLKEVEDTLLATQKIPSTIDESQKKKITPLLAEKARLEEEKKTVDDAFKPQYDEKINAINQQVQDIIAPPVQEKPKEPEQKQPEEKIEEKKPEFIPPSEEEISKLREEDQIAYYTAESLGDANKMQQILEASKPKPKGVPEIQQIADQINTTNNLPPTTTELVKKIDEVKAKKISDAYDEMEHQPQDETVVAAYDQMMKETLQQYNEIVGKGYTIEPYEGEGEPYKSSAEMIKDLRDNKHLYYLKSEKALGGEQEDVSKNLLMKDSGVKINGQPVPFNDIFRAVHDFFGHAKLGNQFGAIGEENAWRIHSQMYSPLAKWAMTSETRGQNSWVNFSGANKEALDKIKAGNRLKKEGKAEEGDKLIKEGQKLFKFAQQKSGLLPIELVEFSEEEKNKLEQQLGKNEEELTADEKKIEENLRKDLTENYEQRKKEYIEKHGLVFNTDEAREFSPEYQKSPTLLSGATQIPARDFVTKMYNDELQKEAPDGVENEVMFLSGGPGAGKSFTTRGMEEKPYIVVDTNLSNFERAVKDIDEALAAGKTVKIVYIYRNPVDAFIDKIGGVIQRMKKPLDQGGGRTVPYKISTAIHEKALNTIVELSEHYKDNPNVKITYFDNTGKKGGAKKTTLESIKSITFDKEEVNKKIKDEIDRQYKNGELTEEQYKGLTKGEETGTLKRRVGQHSLKGPQQKITKTEQNAKRTGKEAQKTGQQTQELEPGPEERLRLRNAEKDRLEAQKTALEKQIRDLRVGKKTNAEAIKADIIESELPPKIQEELLDDLDVAKKVFDKNKGRLQEIAKKRIANLRAVDENLKKLRENVYSGIPIDKIVPIAKIATLFAKRGYLAFEKHMIESGILEKFKMKVEDAREGLKKLFDDTNKIVEPEKVPPPPPEKRITKEEGPSQDKGKRGFVENILENPAISEKFKEAIKNKEDITDYVKTTNDLRNEEANAIIDQVGLAEAKNLLLNESSDIDSNVQFVLAQNLIARYNGLSKTAKADNRIADSRKYLNDVVDIVEFFAPKTTEVAQKLQSLGMMGLLTPEGLLVKMQRDLDRVNKSAKEDANKKVDKIMDELDAMNENSEKDFNRAAEESINQSLEDRIKELENRVKELEIEIAQKPTGKIPRKTGSKNKIFTTEAYQNALRLLKGKGGQTYATIPFGPQMGALVTIGGYHMEAGIRKFSDWLEVMLEDLGGKYKKNLTAVYANVRDKLIEQGYDKKEFDTDAKLKEFYKRVEREEWERKQEKLQKAKERLAEERKNLSTDRSRNYLIKDALVKAGFGTKTGNVNWEKVIGEYKGIQKAREAIEKTLKENTTLSQEQIKEASEDIMDRFKDKIKKKTAKIIQRNIERGLLKRFKDLTGFRDEVSTKDKLDKLNELVNSGAVNKKELLNLFAQDFGLYNMKEEDWAKLQELAEKAQDAPEGYQRETAEEELAYFMQSKMPLPVLKAFRDRQFSRKLSGYATFIKNASGLFEVLFDGFTRTVKTNLNPKYLKKGLYFDPNVIKVFLNTFKNRGEFMSVFLGGNVGKGIIRDTLDKRGMPMVRNLEYRKAKSIFNIPIVTPAYNWLLNKEKYVSRLLDATDAVNQTKISEMKQYSWLKDKIATENPHLSNKEISKMAFAQMYGMDMIEAQKRAKAEFEKRGVKYRKYDVNRRAKEIVKQLRDKEAVIAGDQQGLRGAFKDAPDAIGIASTPTLLLTKLVQGAKNIVEAKGKDKISPKAEEALKFFIDMVQLQIVPFIKGPGNILERGLELIPPYGYLKGGIYNVLAKYQKPSEKQEMISKSGDIYLRATAGLTAMAFIMALMALSRAFDEDDEKEKETGLFGKGSNDYNKQKVIGTVRPENTMRIFGHNISFDYFGTAGIPLRIWAQYLDNERYSKRHRAFDPEKPFRAAGDVTVMSMKSILDASFYTGPNQFTQWLSDPTSDASEKYIDRQIADLFTSSLIPFKQLNQQAYQTIDSGSKEAQGINENILKMSGLIAGWTVDRPTIDYRGRSVDMSVKYPNSAPGFKGIFYKFNEDPIDRWIMDNDASIIIPSRAGGNSPTFGDPPRNMTDQEYYEFRKRTGDDFNKEIKAVYDRYESTQEAVKNAFEQQPEYQNASDDEKKEMVKKYWQKVIQKTYSASKKKVLYEMEKELE